MLDIWELKDILFDLRQYNPTFIDGLINTLNKDSENQENIKKIEKLLCEWIKYVKDKNENEKIKIIKEKLLKVREKELKENNGEFELLLNNL